MKTELFSICGQDAVADSAAQLKICNAFSEALGETNEFSNFNNPKLMLLAFQNALSTADTVLIAADTKIYLKLKNIFISALSLTAAENLKLAAEATAHGADAETVKAHSLMPQKALILKSQDRLYNGFIVKKGDKYLIYIPLDNDRIDSIMKNGLHDFLNKMSNRDSLSAEKAAAPKVESPVTELPPQTHEKPQETAARGAQSSLAVLYENMKDKGWRITVADKGSSGFFLSAIEKTAFYKENYICFKPCEAEFDSDESAVKNSVASVAKSVRESNDTEMGAAISDICVSADNKKYIVIALANSKTARVRKIYSNPGEKKSALMIEAIKQMLEIMTDYTSNLGNPPVNAEVTSMSNAESGVIITPEHKKLSIKMVIGIILVLIVCSVVIALQFDKVSAAVFAMISSTTNTTELTTEETTTESATIPVDVLMDDVAYDDFLDEAFSPENVRGYMEGMTEEADLQTPDIEADNTETIAEETTVEKTTVIETQLTTQITTTKVTTTLATTSLHTTTESAEKQTTAKKTTTASSSTATSSSTTQSILLTASENDVSGVKFTFNTRGYGHGVGMSQDGAIAYARMGWGYEQILLHYFYGNGISLQKDEVTALKTVKYDDMFVPIRTYLVRVALGEIGFPTTGAVPEEAFKAQIVAIYTYAKRYKFVLDSDDHTYLSDSKYNKYVKSMQEETYIYSLVDAVLGEYIAYNSGTAFTPYFASSAGMTVGVGEVWGDAEKYPYLSGGRTSPESVVTATVTVTAEEFRKYVNAYNADNPSRAITLGSDPTQWIEIVNTDSAGYVTKVRVGDKTIKGSTFRSDIMDYDIKSHCFTFECK